MDNNPIRSYRDLRVYQQLYRAMVRVLKEVVPKLPAVEKCDLADQMRRVCKAPPALIAEGFAKRHQKKNWQKYIDDCLGECNEMTNHLSVCIDVYPEYVSSALCEELVEIYNNSGGQLYNLKKSWQNFHG